MAFKLRLDFIQLKNISNTRGFPFIRNKIYEISNIFMAMTLKRYQLHKYHFSTNYTLLFYALAVQIWFIQKILSTKEIL
jgi:aminopeptidase C